MYMHYTVKYIQYMYIMYIQYMIYGHCTGHSHLLIVIVGTDTMDQSLKGGLAHGAGGGHLRPLHYAVETERVCARVKDHYIDLLYCVHRYIYSPIHTILAVGTQFVCIGCSHPTVHTLSYLGVPGFARLLASVPSSHSLIPRYARFRGGYENRHR